jgi:hypothetical protein
MLIDYKREIGLIRPKWLVLLFSHNTLWVFRYNKRDAHHKTPATPATPAHLLRRPTILSGYKASWLISRSRPLKLCLWMFACGRTKELLVELPAIHQPQPCRTTHTHGLCCACDINWRIVESHTQHRSLPIYQMDSCMRWSCSCVNAHSLTAAINNDEWKNASIVRYWLSEHACQ